LHIGAITLSMLNTMKGGVDMNNKILKILCDAGWYENRKIDIHKFIDKWNVENNVIFECAKDFVEKFGDLEITLKQSTKPVYYTIKTSLEYYSMSKHKIITYGNFLSKNVLCVGFITGGNFDLLLSEDGKFYVTVDEDISCWGDNFEDLLNNILTNRIVHSVWDEIEDY
jgi:hypothetical protein